MLDHQVRALHSLEDDLRGKLRQRVGDLVPYLVQHEVLVVNSDEYELIYHDSHTPRQQVSELLKQLCQLSGEKEKCPFGRFMHALREIGFSDEAKCIEETSLHLSDKGLLYPDSGLQWKSAFLMSSKDHVLSDAPSSRPVEECVDLYRNHLLSICREQRWRSLLPEIRTPGADIAEWFVSVQALSSWQAMQGSAANHSTASGAQLGEGFSVSEPMQLLMEIPHLYESTMDVDHEIEFVKSCMVLSSAGTGKTTLCRRLLANYTRRAASRLQEKFPFPVYIQCSDVSRLNATDWETVLGVNDADMTAVLSEAERKLVVEYLLGHAQELLLIIDGVDEVREGEFAATGSKLSGVLCQDRKALKKASVFMTSRSCAAASRLVPHCASLYALAGFTEKQLEQYMGIRLGCDKGRQCMKALCEVSHSHVKEAILAVPLFAVLVVEEYRRAGAIPLNVTSLYGRYLQHAELRWRDRGNKKTLPMEKGGLGPKSLFHKLSAKALEMLGRRQRSSSAAFFAPEVANFGHAIGVLSSGATRPLDVESEAIEFNHVSYQEYLAATNVSRDPSPVEAAKRCVESIGSKEDRWPFWQFLCGLVESHHLLGILSLLKDGQESAALSKKRTCFLMLCLLENQSNFKCKMQPAHNEAAQAIFGIKLDLSHYHLSRLETVGLANVLRLAPCEELDLTSCGISGDQVDLLGDQLPAIPVVTLSGNNLHGKPLERVAAAYHRAHAKRVKNAEQQLDLDRCELRDEDGASIALLMQSTRELSLDAMHLSALPAIAENMVSSPNLRDLCLRDCSLPGGSGTDLCQVLRSAPGLTDLCLSENKLTAADARQLLLQLEGSQIQHLMLENNDISDDITACLVGFLRAVDCRPSRERADPAREPSCTVCLEGNGVPLSCLKAVLEAGCGTQSAVHIGSHFLKCGELQKRNCPLQLMNGEDLCGSGVTDDDASDIADFLEQDTSLSSLDLADNQISDDGACFLAASLKTNSTMHVLDLDKNNVRLPGLLALLHGIKTAPPLPRALRLSRCAVFDSVSPTHPDIRFMRRHLECDNLRVIMLAGTGLDSEVGILLAKALQWNTSLAVVGLCENRLDDAFAAELARSLDDNTTLLQVMLTKNAITETGVRQMIRSPGIRRLQCVWMHGNPCSTLCYAHPLVDSSWIGTSDDLLQQFLDGHHNQPPSEAE